MVYSPGSFCVSRADLAQNLCYSSNRNGRARGPIVGAGHSAATIRPRRYGRALTPSQMRLHRVPSWTVNYAPASARVSRRRSRPLGPLHAWRSRIGTRGLGALLRAVARLSGALARGQVGAGLAYAAHSLKGSAQAVGAWRVADAARAAEIGKGTHGGDRTQVLPTIEASVAEANSFIHLLRATNEPRDSAARD